MTRYDFVPNETTVWIDARSSLHPIHSESTGMTGWLEGTVGDDALDVTAGVSAELEMPVSAMSSGNPLYDREMMRRVDARRFPSINGVLRSMSPAATPGHYTTDGDVTFRGVTKSTSDELAVTVQDDRTIVLEGEHVFNLPDFGMEPPKIMMFKVHPDVTVRVRIVARAAKTAEAAG